jgi:hypothetical protein
MNILKKSIVIGNLFRYKVVAYNPRMYRSFRYVDDEERTYLGAKYWIGANGDMSRYLYDIIDTRTGKLQYDYTEMFRDFNHIKKIIFKTNANYSDPLMIYIFNFKKKWEKRIGVSTSIYFADLMTLYQSEMEKYAPKNL